MKAAIYTDDVHEQKQLAEALKICGIEVLRRVQVTPFVVETGFRQALASEPFDLLVIAQSGPASLGLMDFIHQQQPEIPVIWFSDLDYAVKSYEYGVVWFGKKPVGLADLRKAFQRLFQSSYVIPRYALR